MTYSNPKNFHQCTNLSEWLSVKYGLSYTVFKTKPEIIQNSFIQEFESDTGRTFNESNETTRQTNMEILDEDNFSFGNVFEVYHKQQNS